MNIANMPDIPVITNDGAYNVIKGLFSINSFMILNPVLLSN